MQILDSFTLQAFASVSHRASLAHARGAPQPVPCKAALWLDLSKGFQNEDSRGVLVWA